jgi:hypothetical protein
MKTILICFLAAIVLLAAYLVYQSRTSPNRLEVDPHAAREIEKAKEH